MEEMIGNRDLMMHKTIDVPLFLQFNHCGIQECDPGYRYGFSMRPYHLIHFVLEGSGTLILASTTYTIHAGQAFYIPAGAAGYYYASINNPWKYTWIGFFSDPRNPYIEMIFHGFSVIDISMPLDELERLMLSIIAVTDERAEKISCYRRKDFPGEQFCPITTPEQSLEANSRMLHMFSAFIKAHSGTRLPAPTARNYAADAKAFIDAYYCEHLQIQDVADALHIHPNYLSLVFKNAYHQTPKTYLNSLRMERAAMLLDLTDYPVSVIAGAVGFSNPFQFSSAFKKYFDLSPANYRKHCKS